LTGESREVVSSLGGERQDGLDQAGGILVKKLISAALKKEPMILLFLV